MGKSIYYIRKKPKQRCINPDHFQFYYIDSYCKCTNEDYECDMGFKRTEEGSCIPRNGEDVDLNPPKNCYDNYTIRMGYKKSADNSCVGGVTHEDKELSCPGSGGFLSAVFSFVWNVLYYSVIIGALVFGVYWVILKFKGEENSGIFTADKLPQGGSFGKSDGGYGDISANATKNEIGGMMDDEDDDEDAEEI